MTLRDLYATLQGRHRPEEVAGMVLRLLEDELDRATRQALARAAQGGGWHSLMGGDHCDDHGPVNVL